MLPLDNNNPKKTKEGGFHLRSLKTMSPEWLSVTSAKLQELQALHYQAWSEDTSINHFCAYETYM